MLKFGSLYQTSIPILRKNEFCFCDILFEVCGNETSTFVELGAKKVNTKFKSFNLSSL